MTTTKIDKRKHYILVLDTETANTIEDNLFYDLGAAVVDTHGNVYNHISYVNKDIFCDEEELMQSAYYAEKLPQYHEDIAKGKRKVATTYEIKKAINDLIREYGIKEVCAHNAPFDVRAVNNTQRYVTKSKDRYFFPYGVEIWDTMRMAESVICKMPTYRKFCEENGYICANGQLRKTAEILYRFISGNNEFTENHTGLEDVMIEKEILAYCYRQHKPMRKKAYKD